MISCEPSPGLLGRHQAFTVGQVWLGSQVRGRLLLALSYHLLHPEGLHHWGGGGGEGGGAGPPDSAQRRGEGGERWCEVERGTLRCREEFQGGVLGLMEEQKGLEVFKGLGKGSGGGWWREGQQGQGRAQVPWRELEGRLLPVHL